MDVLFLNKMFTNDGYFYIFTTISYSNIFKTDLNLLLLVVIKKIFKI